MSRTLIFARRNVKEMLRDPLSLIFNVGAPLLMLIFFSMFNDIAQGTDQFSIPVLAPGIIIFAFSFLTLFCGLLVSQDKTGSFMSRLFSSPMTGNDFVFGYFVSALPIALAQVGVFLLTAIVLDVSIVGWGLLWGFLVSIPLSFFYIGCGLLFGTVCSDKSVGGLCSVVITGASILSGMWFPSIVFEQSKAFDVITRVLPFRNQVTLLKLFMSGDFSGADLTKDLVLPLVIVGAYTAVVMVLAVVCFKRKMKSDN